MKINARKEAGLVDPETMQFVELDIFVPSLQLAFEFQVLFYYMHWGSLCLTNFLKIGTTSLFLFLLSASRSLSSQRQNEEEVSREERYHPHHGPLLVGQTERKV